MGKREFLREMVREAREEGERIWGLTREVKDRPSMARLEEACRGVGPTLGRGVLGRALAHLEERHGPMRCPGCGVAMQRQRRRRVYQTLVGAVEVDRWYFYCRRCGQTCAPLDDEMEGYAAQDWPSDCGGAKAGSGSVWILRETRRGLLAVFAAGTPCVQNRRCGMSNEPNLFYVLWQTAQGYRYTSRLWAEWWWCLIGTTSRIAWRTAVICAVVLLSLYVAGHGVKCIVADVQPIVVSALRGGQLDTNAEVLSIGGRVNEVPGVDNELSPPPKQQ